MKVWKPEFENCAIGKFENLKGWTIWTVWKFDSVTTGVRNLSTRNNKVWMFEKFESLKGWKIWKFEQFERVNICKQVFDNYIIAHVNNLKVWKVWNVSRVWTFETFKKLASFENVHVWKFENLSLNIV